MAHEIDQQIHTAILEGEDEEAGRLARAALDAGVDPLNFLETACLPAIREAGQLFADGEYFLPELVTAAQAMKAAMAVIEPQLRGSASARSRGTVVIGTVQGDIHDIGKTLVATLLTANGFEVFDEGADVPVERFVDRAREVGADLVCASALLTTTMSVQRQLVEGVRNAGLPSRVMVGGAPVRQSWADEIGADGFAESAAAAVDVATRLVNDGPS